MTRKDNYKRGSEGEERIKKLLEPFAQFEPTNSRYPDILMKVNGQSYGVECKSLLAVNSGNGGRKGNATISSAEMAGMNALTERGIIPCLIAEIRPPGGPAPKSYFFIDWSVVRTKYDEQKPSIISLTFYWILENGQNLRVWLSTLKKEMAS